MQEAPLLEKLDYSFTSKNRTLSYSDTFVIPLAKTTSDVPLMIKIGTSIPTTSVLRFEFFCIEHPTFRDAVKNIWDQDVQENVSAKTVVAKCGATESATIPRWFW